MTSDGWWYLSTPTMTVAVKVQDGTIIKGAPIVAKFVGQPAKNLERWLRKSGEVEFVRLSD